jgi:long-chain acyl-CoA synthetase
MNRPWLSHYETGVPTGLDYPSVPLTHLLEESVRRYPNRPAIKLVLRHSGGMLARGGLTYRELQGEVNRFAAGLVALGVRPGDRVGLMLPNVPQFVIAFYGALRAGAIVVPTNPTYTPRELERQFADAGIETLVLLSPYMARIQPIRERLAIRRLIVADLPEYLPDGECESVAAALRSEGQVADVPDAPDVLWFRAWLDSQRDLPGTAPTPQDIALFQYTGGTTGVPRAAMLTHANLVANTLQFRSWLPGLHEAEERVAGALPFFHIYGLTVALNLAVRLAAELIVLPVPRPVEHVLQVLETERATVFPGVPTTYISIIHHPNVARYDLRAIKACISGAAPLPMDVQLRFEEITGGKLVEGYGLTEAAPVTHCNPLGGRRKTGSIGLPLPDVDARIVDPETLAAAPPGQDGELWVRGPNVMSGYRNAPEETAHTLTPDGWLRTGDLARMDTEGYFYIVDRLKDIIIVSGLNVVPREVEEVLFEHPAVADAMVAGVPDRYRGEAVKAFVVLRPDRQVSEADLLGFCAERLAPFKVPRSVAFRTDLPKTTVGKPLRRVLVEEARRATDEDAP